MHGGADKRAASVTSLLPVAATAAAIVVLALVVAGGRGGAIVIQRFTISSTTTQHGRTMHPVVIAVVSVAETSADGSLQRSFTSNSFTRPGFQEVDAGNAIQLYDPDDDTIYRSTDQAQQRATLEQLRRTAPKGASVGVGVGKAQALSSVNLNYVPGTTSVYARLLRIGQYRLAGRARIDGRDALKLVQSVATKLGSGSVDGGPAVAITSTSTAYVTPRSYDPIETVTRTRFPGIRSTSVSRWLTYRVLPDTPANRRLLSLTARHPHARVVGNASAYLHASASEIRTTTTG